MAPLGIGSFALRKNVHKNKSYIHVKLTDSAYKSIEDFIKNQDITDGMPSISFRGNDGEFSIPNRGIGSTQFNFTLQDMTDEQGSYESINHSGAKADLEALGPIMAKMKITAKQTDSFQINHEKIAQVQVNSSKRAKVLEPLMGSSSGFDSNCFGRRKSSPVTVTGSKRNIQSISTSTLAMDQSSSSNMSSLDYKKSHNMASHISTFTNSNAGNPPIRPPPSPRSPIKHNPDLLKVPLRERLIQLLAVRSYKKLELHTRISKEGCREKDKKNIVATLLSVSTNANSNYQLRSTFWEEVKEDWSFYTDDEKSLVRLNKAQHVSSAGGERGKSPLPTMPSYISEDTVDYRVTGRTTRVAIKAQHVSPNTGGDKGQSPVPAKPFSPTSLSADTVDYRVTGRTTRVANQSSRVPSQPSRTPSQPSRTPSQPSRTPSQPSRPPNQPSRAPSQPSRAPSQLSRAPSHPSRVPNLPPKKSSQTSRKPKVASVKGVSKAPKDLDSIVNKKHGQEKSSFKKPESYLSKEYISSDSDSSDDEKAAVERNKFQHVSSITGKDKGQPPFLTTPSSPTSISADIANNSVTSRSSRVASQPSRVPNQTPKESNQTSRESKISSIKRSSNAINDLDSTVKKRQRTEKLSYKKPESYLSSHNISSEATNDLVSTDDEKAVVEQNKAQHMSSNAGVDKGQFPFPTMTSPTSISADTVDYRLTGRSTRVASEPFKAPNQTTRAPSQPPKESSRTLKEYSQTSIESNISSAKRYSDATNYLDPIVKKRQGHEKLPCKESKPNSYLSSQNRSQSYGDSNSVVNDDTTNSSTMPSSHNDYHIPASGKLSPISSVSKNHHVTGYNNNHKPYSSSFAVPGTSTTPGPSNTNHKDGVEPEYLREYTKITTQKQRTQYKANFKKYYQTYIELHKFIDSYTKKFGVLDNALKNEEKDSREYNRIKLEIIREYNVCQEDKTFQNSRKEYNYLNEKLMHIKQLVAEYDNSPAY